MSSLGPTNIYSKWIVEETSLLCYAHILRGNSGALVVSFESGPPHLL